MKQLRKDYFLEEYVFVNSNLDIDSLSIVNDNKLKKVCSLCKNINKSNENPKTVVDESVKFEKFNKSDMNSWTWDSKWRYSYVFDPCNIHSKRRHAF